MRVAIVCICLGNYRIFWKEFYLSAESKLLPGAEKHYFVFTDKKISPTSARVHVVKHPALEWPYSTLLRFEFFCKIQERLQEFDYVYFFNGNALFSKEIGSEILPDRSHQFVGVVHPYYFFQARETFPYEKNQNSLAYIPESQGKHYMQGALIGARTADFLMMSKVLEQNIRQDLQNNIIAVWHDESHWNKYVLNKDVKILSCAYNYPENYSMAPYGLNLPFDKIILMRDKSRYGGHARLRDDSWRSRMILAMRIWKIDSFKNTCTRFVKRVFLKLKHILRNKNDFL